MLPGQPPAKEGWGFLYTDLGLNEPRNPIQVREIEPAITADLFNRTAPDRVPLLVIGAFQPEPDHKRIVSTFQIVASKEKENWLMSQFTERASFERLGRVS
ncbi:MAG TPA: hypothetical protein VK249_06805 [Anaerolineales bacterium]|nr:hypothetical protein [Anaerolineales bacterium]